FIQTPGWFAPPKLWSDGPRAPSMDTWLRVTAPNDDVMMVSVEHIDVDIYVENLVELYTERNGSRVRVWAGTGSLTPFPDLFGGVLHVHFTSYWPLKTSELKLLVSFHQPGSIPERLPSGEWNCSVPHWADFRRHFHCNFDVECEGGEDETECPYTATRCGSATGILIGNRCYVLGHPLKPITWTEASVACLSLNAQLVSFNTWDEKEKVADVILGRRLIDVYLGIKTAATYLPHMYRNLGQLEDNTMSWFVHYMQHTKPPACGTWSGKYASGDQRRFGNVHLDYCNVPQPVYYLCESDPGGAAGNRGMTADGRAGGLDEGGAGNSIAEGQAGVAPGSQPEDNQRKSSAAGLDAYSSTYGGGVTSGTHGVKGNTEEGGALFENTTSVPKMHLPVLESNETIPVPSVRCPDGHVTHLFLACDIPSACWSDDSVSGTRRSTTESDNFVTSCSAPVTSLPPSFACAVSGERVPYSLVCDHRADCRDNSDEGFCVFPPCTASAPLQCGNSGQVDCVNGKDEQHCSTRTTLTTATAAWSPVQFDFDGRGGYKLTRLNLAPHREDAAKRAGKRSQE
ncbi:hypothetical protein BaRGS_00006239, partial [Batillaria attramentaria]